MERYEIVAMAKLRDQAFRKIHQDPELWKRWHECKDQSGRELLMTWAISCIAYERGYREGWYDSEARSIAIAAEEDAGADY